MVKVEFEKNAADALLKYAVIFARYKGKWVFCKHKERETFECPGGHREKGEDILTAAKRELYEETGALRFALEQMGAYSVTDDDGAKSYGMLYFAEIEEFGPLPEEFEMEKIQLFEEFPEKWTYPHIQPVLLGWAAKRLKKE